MDPTVTDEYDFWLFDLDGTLVDVEQSYAHEVLEEVGDRLGCAFTDQEKRFLWHGVGTPRAEVLAREGIDERRFWDVFHAIEDPEKRAEATYLHDDAAAIADIDAPVGIVTHCQSYLTWPVLDSLDVTDWFDTVVCCDDDLGWKPDPAPVYRAMADLGLATGGREGVLTDGGTTHRGVLAGDRAADVGAAWNAGLDAVHVERHGHDVRGRCIRGDYRIESFDQLFS